MCLQLASLHVEAVVGFVGAASEGKPIYFVFSDGPKQITWPSPESVWEEFPESV